MRCDTDFGFWTAHIHMRTKELEIKVVRKFKQFVFRCNML